MSCPEGQYFCNDRQKCMPIPKGKKVRKDGELVSEVAPPGWGHTKAEKEKTKPWKPKSKIGGTAAAFKRALDDGRFKGLPGDKTKKEKTASMFKLMWSMKKKGDKPHYKPGTDKKYKKYQDESVRDGRIGEKTTMRLLPDAFYDKNLIEKYGDTFDSEKYKKKRAEDQDRLKERDLRMKHGSKKVGKDWKKFSKELAARDTAASRRDPKKGVRFMDSKGKGYIKGGKKTYD